MVRIRRLEEKCAQLYGEMKIRGFLHLYIGEEAVATGAVSALGSDDAVVATYREHAHPLARGGRGGSIHLFDPTTRFHGGNAIVGGGLPLAVGLALADKMQGRERISAC